MFIIFSAEKMLGSHWLMYVIRMLLCTQKHQTMVRAQTAALGMKLHFICRQSGSRMEHYTNTELVNMHPAYGAALCNGQAAQLLYAKHYSNRVTPSHIYFGRLHQRLSDNGFVTVNTRARKRTVGTLENEKSVLDVLQNNSSKQYVGYHQSCRDSPFVCLVDSAY